MKSIIEKEPAEECYLCRNCRNLECHHIFGGANRRWSEKYGLKVHLCPVCHRDNKNGVHGNSELAKQLHELGQREFEKKHSRKEFMRIFGRNYLDGTGE